MDVSPRHFTSHRCRPLLLALLALPLVSVAQEGGPRPGDGLFSPLVALVVGLGMILVAVGVIAFAVRQLKREARERRRLYRVRHRGDDHSAPTTNR